MPWHRRALTPRSKDEYAIICTTPELEDDERSRRLVKVLTTDESHVT